MLQHKRGTLVAWVDQFNKAWYSKNPATRCDVSLSTTCHGLLVYLVIPAGSLRGQFAGHCPCPWWAPAPVAQTAHLGCGRHPCHIHVFAHGCALVPALVLPPCHPHLHAHIRTGGRGRGGARMGPWGRFQKRLDRRLEEVAEAVGGGYCRLQMPLKRALAVRQTVSGHRWGGWRPSLPGARATRPQPAWTRVRVWVRGHGRHKERAEGKATGKRKRKATGKGDGTEQGRAMTAAKIQWQTCPLTQILRPRTLRGFDLMMALDGARW